MIPPKFKIVRAKTYAVSTTKKGATSYWLTVRGILPGAIHLKKPRTIQISPGLRKSKCASFIACLTSDSERLSRDRLSQMDSIFPFFPEIKFLRWPLSARLSKNGSGLRLYFRAGQIEAPRGREIVAASLRLGSDTFLYFSGPVLQVKLREGAQNGIVDALAGRKGSLR